MDLCVQDAILSVSSYVKAFRSPSGSYDENGRWSDHGTTQELGFCAAVQRAKAEDLEDLDEGRRSSKAVKLFTSFELRTASVDGQSQPDILEISGERYQVQSVEYWPDGGYYKAVATKVGQ